MKGPKLSARKCCKVRHVASPCRALKALACECWLSKQTFEKLAPCNSIASAGTASARVARTEHSMLRGVSSIFGIDGGGSDGGRVGRGWKQNAAKTGPLPGRGHNPADRMQGPYPTAKMSQTKGLGGGQTMPGSPHKDARGLRRRRIMLKAEPKTKKRRCL